ncbi:hypothetical protein HDV00_002409 [Rhizophlyctis rosea]|nr:hypothetical protein HDV00_002409 [Rhizophlyctis rosea]
MLRTSSIAVNPFGPFIGAETLRHLIAYAAVNSNAFSAPWTILLSESIQLGVSITAHTLHSSSKPSSAASVFTNRKEFYQNALPSALHIISSNLWFAALQYTTPSHLFLATLASLPLSAALHHLVIKRQSSRAVWASIGLICLGLLISQAPDEYIDYVLIRQKNGTSPDPVKGFLFGLLIALFSSVSSTYLEVNVKDELPTLWASHLFGKMWGTFFAVVSLIEMVILGMPIGRGRVLTMVPVVVVLIMSGILRAVMERGEARLSLPMGLAWTAGFITIGQAMFIEELTLTSFSFHSVLGCGLAAVGCWAYGQYRIVESEEWNRLPDTDRSPSPPARDGHKAQAPSSRRVIGCMFAAFALALFGEAMTSQDGPLSSSDTSSNQSTETIIPPLNLTALEDKPYELRVAKDIVRYFEPHGIRPAVWGQEHTEGDGCVYNWMQNNGIKSNTSEGINYAEALAKSGCPIYPSMGMLTHIYWGGPWRKFQLVGIDSWLATQPLRDGHKLIYWHTVDPGEDIRAIYKVWTQAGVLEFRFFDPELEARGTCIENMPEWTDEAYRKEIGLAPVSMSDLIRTLLLSKYGGIWMDTDNVILRDLTPLIRAGPTVPLINPNGSYFNDNILVHGPLTSGISKKVLETACTISYNVTKWQYGEHVKPANWVWLYNDGLYKTCYHETHCGMQGYPIGFMDGWCWQDHEPRLFGNSEGFSVYGKHPPFDGLWVWHGRLNQMEEKVFDPSMQRKATTLGAVTWRIVRDLVERREKDGANNGGLDLFAGENSWGAKLLASA